MRIACLKRLPKLVCQKVVQLKLNDQGEACLTLKENEVLKNYEGNYSITFLRPPSEKMDT